jgi:hypothetical protein
MPTYTFKDPDGQLCQRRLSFDEYDAVKAGEQTVEDDQGRPLVLVFNPGNPNFVMKDGEHGGWTSKANRENNYRREREAEMRRREKDHVFKNKLVPNYGGEEAPSWKEAQEEARSQKGDLSASTYDHLVSQEKAG